MTHFFRMECWHPTRGPGEGCVIAKIISSRTLAFSHSPLADWETEAQNRERSLCLSERPPGTLLAEQPAQPLCDVYLEGLWKHGIHPCPLSSHRLAPQPPST
jgi:hypothetical protein